jgi:hypothetical protein
VHKYSGTHLPHIGRRGRSGGSTSRQEGLVSIIACRNAQIITAGMVPVGLWRLRESTSHSGPAARAQSCLTRAGRRPVVWPHEIPDSGISHWNAGSGPRSGTEAGDISPVFVALEHAAGDFTTLGKNPLHGGSSPPSDTLNPHDLLFPGMRNRHPGQAFGRGGCFYIASRSAAASFPWFRGECQWSLPMVTDDASWLPARRVRSSGS